MRAWYPYEGFPILSHNVSVKKEHSSSSSLSSLPTTVSSESIPSRYPTWRLIQKKIRSQRVLRSSPFWRVDRRQIFVARLLWHIFEGITHLKLACGNRVACFSHESLHSPPAYLEYYRRGSSSRRAPASFRLTMYSWCASWSQCRSGILWILERADIWTHDLILIHSERKWCDAGVACRK